MRDAATIRPTSALGIDPTASFTSKPIWPGGPRRRWSPTASLFVTVFGQPLSASKPISFKNCSAANSPSEFARQGISHTVPAAIHNSANKLLRIRRLGPYLSQRRLRFLASSPSSHLLVDQLRDFPTGAHDDGPDALEMALRLAEDVWKVETATMASDTDYRWDK